jgi:hypothetical protein
MKIERGSSFFRFIMSAVCLLIAGSAAVLAWTESNIPRPEHPKPQFQRDTWINLNGPWDFAMDPEVTGIKENWQDSPSKFDGKIIVPFCVESKLSGMRHTDFIKAVWYHRFFDLPGAWRNRRVFLHFGGVDYECRAWVNGKSVGRHHGGSVSFAFEITEAVKEGRNELVVYAFDDVLSEVQPSGKQSMRPESHGVFYTRVTGIWQTVWNRTVSSTRASLASGKPSGSRRGQNSSWNRSTSSPMSTESASSCLRQ